MKIGTSTKLKIKDYSTTYGSIDKKQCTGIYLQLISWVHPVNDYKKDIDRFKHQFEREMNPTIKEIFQPLKSTNLYCIDDRQSNGVDRTNHQFTLLPIEVTLLFHNEIDYNQHKDKYKLLLSKMVDYIENYNNLVFNKNNYK